MSKKFKSLIILLTTFGLSIPVIRADINFGGDFNFRIRQNFDKDASNKGFQLYEVELFIDAAVHKNFSIFAECPIYHSNRVDLGNAWIDIHNADELAATGYTGLMVGHMMPWYGFYGYDDNQSWIYGGRTTTNTTLVRHEAVEGTVLRDRQVGIVANIKVGSFLFTPQIYNGAGYWRIAGGTDNDNKKDFVFRVQYSLPGEIGRFGGGYWNAQKTEGALAPSRGTAYGSGGVKHPRDIQRFTVFFQFPNVPHAAVPDLSLGDKPFTIFGEFHRAKHYGNTDAPGYELDQKVMGYWAEANVRIIYNKLVAVMRYDYLDPNTDLKEDHIRGITTALKLELVPMVFLTFGYEYYGGGENAGELIKEDRLVLETSIQF